MSDRTSPSKIRIHNARQHNLKNLNLEIALGELTVVTGPSGSGKSSLVFDTLYAEGQRRYVETFSAYARQFLDRMDKPAVDRIEGIPPAIAIDQSNPVRNSRSTVGTMTELNDHLKLLFARAGALFDAQTAQLVRRDTAESIYAELLSRTSKNDPRLVVTFEALLPGDMAEAEIAQWLSVSGFSRIQAQRQVSMANTPSADKKSKAKVSAQAMWSLDVVADRFRIHQAEKSRALEALEAALKRGHGRIRVYASTDNAKPDEVTIWPFSSGLHDPHSNRSYADPQPGLFSFNSAQGACENCRGFGRVIGVDDNLVIPDGHKTLRGGAIKPLQTPAWKECQADLLRHSSTAGVPRDTPWLQLTAAQKRWVMEGSPDWTGDWKTQWYGVRRFFTYLESKAYKMHIRVLLSKYRSYTTCPVCQGARLKPEALLWRLGGAAEANAALPVEQRFLPSDVSWTREQLHSLPGLCLHDVMQLPIERARRFFDVLKLPSAMLDEALQRLVEEIRTRFKYLCDVGLGYLTLDRQSRTLSGGEVQRINLTTALGTSLVNTLFVLDEPSIGLHPRDMDRIVQAMLRLRDAGNTLVVVEHDPAVMLAADRLIDMGPGPGERGGQMVFDGTPAAIRQAKTLTGDYLSGRKTVSMGIKRMVTNQTPRLILQGAREHNLRNLDVTFPLKHLVCITGVSGSGKSSLIQDVLYPALARHLGKPTDQHGAHDRLRGADLLGDVVMVDQSPIGKTARSTPASYVGVFDEIRALFVQTPLAVQRGYTAATFSFNTGNGRCPTCSGSGFEHVEMQFLSDIYLRCADCDGLRFRPEVLEVGITLDHSSDKSAEFAPPRELSMADVLALTVSEAVQVFAHEPALLRKLQPLIDVGLEYIKLGQPVPTLSGGEAQRLKLAAFLGQVPSSAEAEKLTAQRKARVTKTAAQPDKGTLFLFDEPTTGLHFDDISKLMRAFRRLLEAGHSVIVIEHNLDVIRASDWLIDMGPEGGEAGGQIVCEGPPELVKRHPDSHTGRALAEYDLQLGLDHEVRERRPKLATVSKITPRGKPGHISIVNAREHNLQSLHVDIPRGCFNVITGVSGSGKSTLAFDILFNEGQRRYLESLNAYARSIVQPAGRPLVDAVHGIAPTVAIEQRLSRGGQKSTVATITEIWHFLRLIFVKLGTQHCVNDGTPVRAQSVEGITAQLLRDHKGQHVGVLAPMVINRKGIYTEQAQWAKARGHTHLRVDGDFVPVEPWPVLDRFKEHTIELPVGDIVIKANNENQLRALLAQALQVGKGVMHLLTPLDGLQAAVHGGGSTRHIGEVKVFSTRHACPVCDASYPELDPRLFSYNSKHGWCTTCVGTGLALTADQRKTYDDSVLTADDQGRERTFPSEDPGLDDLGTRLCPACQGTRLNPMARHVRFQDQTITHWAQSSVDQARSWALALQLQGRDADIARDVLTEIQSRLKFLQDVGLGYLTLDRAAPTLSGGEAQRIRLAAQLGSALQGVCYVLDEPTIGLHPRDNQILLKALRSLCEQGNTLVVVEHDEDTMRHADHLIDIGPSAGKRGGMLVAQGSVADLMAEPRSLTGRFLAQPMQHPLQARRPVDLAQHPRLIVRQARLHNLQALDVAVPLQRLVAITGVSGSGKSTLARDVLAANLQFINNLKGRAAKTFKPTWQHCEAIEGWQQLARVLEVDQTPIGKTPRSCPATYIGFWDDIRRLFAETLEAKARGYTPTRFSFNTGDGRCPACEGQGMRTVAMSFLPDVKVLCETCQGQRFNPETLAVQWRERHIGEVLNMEVDAAVEFFTNMPAIHHPLRLLQDVGLGYLTLGQPSPTLSGGEAQRLKLVAELSKVREDVARRGPQTPHTLYVLDEPTVGLHMADVEKLILVLHRLVNAGHSVLVIEHDLELIAEADWVIDLGPEGGGKGGQVVAAAPPETLVQTPQSHTGAALQSVLGKNAPRPVALRQVAPQGG